MGAKTAQENPGRFHCLKCGRKHNRSSDIGSFHHRGLDVGREDFEPETVAVGIAFVNAAEGRNVLRATIDEVEEQFQELGFDNQFPGADVEAEIQDWKQRGMVGDVRHSGRHWFEFLANRRTPRGEKRSPDSFRIWMKNFANEFDRASVR